MEESYGAIIFIVLDLASGYLQIPLTESAEEKTAFITQDETIFASHEPKHALVYFDDIFIHAND